MGFIVSSPGFWYLWKCKYVLYHYYKGEQNNVLMTILRLYHPPIHIIQPNFLLIWLAATMHISSVNWLVPTTTALHPTPALTLLSWGESVSVAATAPVHKRPAFPWARVEVPEQNIFWTGPLWHRLLAVVRCWNCMWGGEKKGKNTVFRLLDMLQKWKHCFSMFEGWDTDLNLHYSCVMKYTLK